MEDETNFQYPIFLGLGLLKLPKGTPSECTLAIGTMGVDPEGAQAHKIWSGGTLILMSPKVSASYVHL